MKLSNYNYIVKGKKEILIWNTFSGALLKFKSSQFQKLENLDLEQFSDKEINTLIKNGILIENNKFSEKDEVLSKRASSMFAEKNVVTFTVALTEKCNASCYYCYQRDNCNLKESGITVQDYDKIVDFICQRSNGKNVKIIWFGGEPLLKKDVILYMCNELSKREIKFISNIITNGLLLSKVDIDELKSIMHINKIQVTFDGLYEKHDIRKGFREKSNSFMKIVLAIDNLLKKDVQIVIRLNVSKENYNELAEIIDYFSKKFKNYNNIRFYYELLSDDSGNSNFAIAKSMRKSTTQKLFESTFKYKQKSITLPKRRNHFCGAQSINSYFIDIYGNLYSCEHHLWDFDKKIGTISNFDFEEYSKKKISDVLSGKCKKCIFLPVCQGGCVRNNKNECPLYIFNIQKELNMRLEDMERGCKNGSNS